MKDEFFSRQPAADQPDANQPDADQPDAAANQPDADQPTANQPDANQPAANQPDANQPDANQPYADQPEESKFCCVTDDICISSQIALVFFQFLLRLLIVPLLLLQWLDEYSWNCVFGSIKDYCEDTIYSGLHI